LQLYAANVYRNSRRIPAIASGITDHIWTIEEIVKLATRDLISSHEQKKKH
jgi:hypothetical protein